MSFSSGNSPVFLHEFFEQAARRNPDRVAIDVPPSSTRPDRRRVSYADLERRANALAQHLEAFVRQEERIVVVLLPRATELLYLSQLAILKAGAAHTCIDPAFPDQQVCTILEDSQAVAILTDEIGRARLSRIHTTVPVLEIAQCEQVSTGVDVAPQPIFLSPHHLAYLIYTSGTTGQPKGVMIEHRSIANLVRGDLEQLGVTPEDRVAQNSSSAYDSSVEETWFALAAGATLVVMDEETTRLGPDLIPWLRRECVTMFCPPPTLLRSTGCDDPASALPDLRLIHVGGEALPQDVADRWSRGRRLVNDYGPTETTVTALRGPIHPGQPVSIGQPVPGMCARVLDEHLNPVPDGQQGELCLSGVGLARGYRNAPELTAQKFPIHPRLGRIYRTGDLVSRNGKGEFFCHGRIDAQVKIRGYRIELEAIETRLVACPGVREAACTVQGEGARKRIVAFVVPDPAAETPPNFEQLKSSLRQVLPAYMVPAQFNSIPVLPRDTSSKLSRKALPVLPDSEPGEDRHSTSPQTALEKKIATAFAQVLERNDTLSVHEDFFDGLGGNSLLAAMLISALRKDPETATLTVRHIYEARTVAELAKHVGPLGAPAQKQADGHRAGANRERTVGARPILATLVQGVGLLAGLLVAAPLAYIVAFQIVPFLVGSLSSVALVLLTPLFLSTALVGYAFVSVLMAVLAKKLLIGRYVPLRAPVWGSFYVRNWIVQQWVRLVPWSLLEGTLFQQLALRALGARIGKRVHIHRGVNLQLGGWDLLEIGDDVTLSQDASVRLVEFEDRFIIVAAVALENGATLEVRAGVAGNTRMEEGAYLTALSFLPRGSRIPRGESWSGIPARRVGAAAEPPALPKRAQSDLSPLAHGSALLLARIGLGMFLTLPVLAASVFAAMLLGLDHSTALAWISEPSLGPRLILWDVFSACAVVPVTLAVELIAMRMLGRVQPGVISRWSRDYLRVCLKTRLVDSASRWLSGSLLWPVWLRLAGMKIGRNCEIGIILDTVPELVAIGSETFFADGVYLAGPRVHRGTVTIAPVKLGDNVFLGNHVVIAPEQTIPPDVLIGVSTVATSTTLRSGTSWFGHPPFELHNREPIEYTRDFTHDPTWLRYLSRLFWELLRFTLPILPVSVVLAWFKLLTMAEGSVSLPVFIFGVIPLLELGVVAFLLTLVLGAKWLLLGRVRPGTHPLWSSWCSRWDFFYAVWDLWASSSLLAIEGTLLLNWYLRAAGMRIGRNVILGPGCGFVHVVDPDMLSFEDGVTASCLFQAHTFEDRVLKIDSVRIRRQATVGSSAVLLYGADIGEESYVAPHSVVMKGERLMPGGTYAGSPVELIATAAFNSH